MGNATSDPTKKDSDDIQKKESQESRDWSFDEKVKLDEEADLDEAETADKNTKSMLYTEICKFYLYEILYRMLSNM